LRDTRWDAHDLEADWCWARLTLSRDRLAESRMDEVFRRTQGTGLAERYKSAEFVLAEAYPRVGWER
jgi:hypothetical protein